jgi:hypothetical protein
MKLSGDDFRLVFWIALVPAYLSIMVLLVAVKELPSDYDGSLPRLSIRRGDIIALPAAFWWVISIAALLSLARFSQAFLVLKANVNRVRECPLLGNSGHRVDWYQLLICLKGDPCATPL